MWPELTPGHGETPRRAKSRGLRHHYWRIRTPQEEKSWDVSIPVVNELVPTPPRTPPLGKSESAILPQLISHPGTSSGSYLHAIVEAVRARHRLNAPGQDSPDLELSVKALRSTDHEEYTLTNRETGKVVFKGAKCYGLRTSSDGWARRWACRPGKVVPGGWSEVVQGR
jgi:hypothetical protein